MSDASGKRLRAKNYIKMLINIPRFSPQSTQRTQSMDAFFYKYLRRNVILYLRKSADSNCQGIFFAEHSARTD
jgi:hypothetical protein